MSAAVGKTLQRDAIENENKKNEEMKREEFGLRLKKGYKEIERTPRRDLPVVHHTGAISGKY